MLNEIGSVAKVPEFIKRVKSGEGGDRLMGFGHRVYKSYDPRAKVIKQIADLVFTVTGKNPLLEIALELERIALQDDYFVTPQALPERRLLLGPDLSGDGLPGRDVPGALRHPAHRRLDRAVGGDAARSGAEDRPAAADLHRARRSATTCRARQTSSDRSTAAERRCSSCSRWRLPACRRAGGAGSSTPNRAWEHLRQLVAIGPRPSGSPAIEQTRNYIKDQLAAAGVAVAEQAWDDETPVGKVQMVNLDRDDPGRAQGPHRHRRPLRHEAVPRSSGSSARATADRARRSCSSWRACSRRGGTRSRSSCCSSTARKRVTEVGGHRQHLRQPPLRRGGAARRLARRR